MDRMSPLDAGFLELEDEDSHASLAIASLAVFEGPTPTYEQFLAAIAGRLALVARYRQKVRQIPLDLGRPVWVDDPHFDLRYHVRHTALPAPGGDAQVCRLIEQAMADRLDRARPLWESWLVEGLQGGRWALLSKVHHCMVDGISGTDLYRVLFDITPQPAPAVEDRWTPVAEPSTVRLTAEALRELAFGPVRQVRALRGALRTPRRFARRSADTARGLTALGRAVVPADASSLNGPVGQDRRYRLLRSRLADINGAGHDFGATVNDVVLSAITGGFRELLLSRGEQPGRHVVRALVPVSVRAPGEEGIYENRISLLLADLPVDIADPAQRLEAMHARLATLKASKEAEAGEAMTSLARYGPFPLIALGTRLAFKIPQRNIVTVTTNVPGPRQPLYVLGRRALEIFPYVPIATTLRFGVAVFSYCDQVTIGITGDRGSTPDIDVLARAIEHSLTEYVRLSQRRRPGGSARQRVVRQHGTTHNGRRPDRLEDPASARRLPPRAANGRHRPVTRATSASTARPMAAPPTTSSGRCAPT